MKTSLEMNEEYGMMTFRNYFYLDYINSPGWCLNSKINAFYLEMRLTHYGQVLHLV